MGHCNGCSWEGVRLHWPPRGLSSACRDSHSSDD